MKYSKIAIMFIAICILTFIPNQSIAIEKNEITIIIDENLENFKTKPQLISGTVLVPMREIFEKLGAEVSWNQPLKEITAKKEDISIKMQINSNNAYVGTKLLKLDNAPMLLNDVTMVPIRAIGETFGYDVTWDQEKKQINIKSIVVSNDAEVSDTLLTYKDAINDGIKTSADYNQAIINSEKATSINKDSYVALGTYDLTSIQMKKSATLNEKWSEMQLAITADRVGNNVKNDMDNISIMKEELKIKEDYCDFLTEKLRLAKLKFDKGILSKSELNNIVSEKESELQNQEVLKTKIAGAYTKLNNTLNKPSKERQNLEYNLGYKEVGDVDLDDKCVKAIAEDPYIWYSQQNVENKEFNLVTYEYNSGGQSWNLTKLDVSQAKRSLTDTKNGLSNVIHERYNSLKEIEENIKTLEINLQQAKNVANTIGIQYVAGLTTQNQAEEAQQNIVKLELEIKKVKLQHGQLKVLFEKPYIAPEYFSAG